MKDAVVVVTGGGRGIGRAICQRFAAAGAQVVAVARTAEELERTRGSIIEAGGRCEIERTDLTKPDEIKRLIAGVMSRHERLDVLVNCAGMAALGTISDLGPRVFETLLAVNVKAVYLTCRQAWPIMQRQGGGVIVNISSVASVDPFPGFSAYGAAKAWVNTWSLALAGEGKQHGIRVYAVAPGAVETRMLRNAFPDFPADQTLQPEEIAEVVFAAAAEDGKYESGQTVFVKK